MLLSHWGQKPLLSELSSTIMHEMKHAIDQNSHAAVEGYAREGAAFSVERQVWPIFIKEAMAGQPDMLAAAMLDTVIYNFRYPATTDATLKIFLRESCNDEEPDTIDYAKAIVRSYGYHQESFLNLRSQRAHRDTQYLEYEYGLAQYNDVRTDLQKGFGPAQRVDAYLLQACKMTNPKKDQASIDLLSTCIHERTK